VVEVVAARPGSRAQCLFHLPQDTTARLPLPGAAGFAIRCLRVYSETMPSKPHALASKPVYDPALQAIRFEFWKGNVKRAGTFRIPNMTPETALDYFMMNWAQIGPVAAKTPPISGEVKLRFGGV
jgi:hypothetical protein